MRGTSFELTEILERISDAFVALDNNWCYTYVNKKAGEILHRNPNDLIGKHLLTEYPEFKNQLLYHAFHKAISEQQYVYLEEFCQPFNAWFENHIYPSAGGLTIFYRDITERKKIEEQLSKSEAQYGILVENIHEALIVEDTDGNLVYANKGFRRIFGYDTDEPLKLTLKDYTSPNSYVEVIKRHINRVNGKPELEEFEYRGLRKDGTEIWLEARVTTIVENGKITGTRSLERDITERKKAERRIIDNENYLRTIIETEPECVKQITRNGILLDMNPAGLHMIEAGSLQQVIGKCVYGIIDEPYRDDYIRLTHEVFDGKSGKMEFKITGLKGCKRWLETHAVPLRDNDGNIISSLCISRDISDRKNAEAEIKKNQNRFQSMVENNDGIIALLDENFDLIYRSPSAERITGWTDKERNAFRSYELIHPDDREMIKALIASLHSTPGKLFPLTVRGKHKNGSYIYLDGAAISLLHDPNVGAIVTNVRDITESRKSQEALKASEEKYRFLFERNLAGVYQSKLNGSIFTCNEAFARMLGYDSANELLFQDARQLYFTNTDRNNFITQLSEKGELTNHETKMKKKDGSPIYIIENCSIQMQHSTGEAIIEGMMVDITDRKKAEAEINASQERFRTLYEENPLMNFTLDENGIVLSVNKRGASDLGYHCNELVGTSVLNVFFPEDRQAVLRQIHKCVLNPRKSYSWEMRKVTKDGNTIWVSETGTALVDANGKNLVMIVCENITEKKNAELEIKHINNQLHNLTTHLESIREEERTNIAREIHDELGQQLTGIKMDLTMLNQILKPANISIAKRISGVMLMVDDTIKAVRKISTRLRPAVLDDLGLIATLDAHCLEFEKRFNIQCNCKCNSIVEEQDFDKSFATGIFRIFQESLTNIARHSKATSIQCNLIQDGNQLVLSIKDNGLGFKIDEMQNNSLGILGMKERAMMMNGKLTIESHEGKGTQIILKAPVRLHTHD